MAIINALKETGLDIYLNYHPKVLLLKKQAKQLHKELKDKKLTLMQCQGIVAKDAGFDNWHHFMALIKNNYSSELDKKLFTITKEPVLEGDYILLGHDINFNHYKWQDDSDMKTHQLIIGKELYNTYDLFLAQQAIQKNKEVFLINQSEEKDIDSLIQYAKNSGRENDIRIFDFTNNPKYIQYQKRINNRSNRNNISDTILYSLGTHESNELLKKAKILIPCLIEIFISQTKHSKEILNFNNFRKNLSFESIIELLKTNKLDSSIKTSLINYLALLPDFNVLSEIQSEKTIENHNHLKIRIVQAIEWLNNPIFSQDGISLEHFLFKEEENQMIHNKEKPNYINIFNFGKNTDKLSHTFSYQFLILSSLTSNVAYFLGTPSKKTLSELMKAKKKETKYIFIKECYMPETMAVFNSQARSSGISLTFIYQSIENTERLLSKNFIHSMVANTLTHILSDEDKIKMINKQWLFYNKPPSFKDEVVSPNINTSVFMQQQQNNYFWIIKNNNRYQINIDNIKMVSLKVDSA